MTKSFLFIISPNSYLDISVQIGIFSILGKILFDIGLNILTSLMDEEAWGLALQFIQSLNIYNLPYNARYFLLSAEIYLANNKAVKACDLLKCEFIPLANAQFCFYKF